jgi:hypothetical protein
MRNALSTRLAGAALSLCIFATWMLQYPYAGISFNDSSLYTLQALARIHPDTVRNDIFLRFGSQDHYTFFSPIFASAIRLLDLEPAAALLTLLGQGVFLACAWLLARRVMPRGYALLAMALLVALPSSYGVGNFFSYIESFLTPRQVAEALVLAGLAMLTARRFWLSGICALAAALLHPIMAFSGIVMALSLQVAVPRPKLALVAGATLSAVLLIPIVVVPTAPFAPFDTTWLQLITDYTSYLFPTQWPLEDWGRVSVPAAVLVTGILTAADPLVRRLCRAALITGACGLGVTLVYCDGLHSVIFTQMQPWRWLWLMEVMAVLLLPVIGRDCWRSGVAGRPAVVLLASAWVLRDFPATLCVSVLVIVSLLIGSRLTEPRSARLILQGSVALLVVAIVIDLTSKLSSPVEAWTRDGLFCSAILISAWWWMQTRNSPTNAIALLVAATLLCACLAPTTWRSWTDYRYTPALRAAFAAWREKIPAQAQVLWPGTPVGAWYLLERPSYYSIHQVAGNIFSRPKAVEIHRRAQLLQRALNAQGHDSPPGPHPAGPANIPVNADKLSAPGFALVCSDPELGYVVSWSALGPVQLAPVAPNQNKPRSQLRLNSCAEVRSRPVAAQTPIP